MQSLAARAVARTVRTRDTATIPSCPTCGSALDLSHHSEQRPDELIGSCRSCHRAWAVLGPPGSPRYGLEPISWHPADIRS
jgi:hypothetical protein